MLVNVNSAGEGRQKPLSNEWYFVTYFWHQEISQCKHCKITDSSFTITTRVTLQFSFQSSTVGVLGNGIPV